MTNNPLITQVIWGFTQFIWRFTQVIWGFTQVIWGFTQVIWRFTQVTWRFTQVTWRFTQVIWRFTQVIWIIKDKPCNSWIPEAEPPKTSGVFGPQNDGSLGKAGDFFGFKYGHFWYRHVRFLGCFCKFMVDFTESDSLLLMAEILLTS